MGACLTTRWFPCLCRMYGVCNRVCVLLTRVALRALFDIIYIDRSVDRYRFVNVLLLMARFFLYGLFCRLKCGNWVCASERGDDSLSRDTFGRNGCWVCSHGSDGLLASSLVRVSPAPTASAGFLLPV